MENISSEPVVGMGKGRIEALNDGVFAIAMTLLILNIELPTGHQNLQDIYGWFYYAIPLFFDYGLSFILLAFFWTAQHRQFHWIKRIDDKLLWLNIILLLFIVMVPLSTDLFGEHRTMWPTALFINTNLFLVLVMIYGMWLYASSHPELLDPNLAAEHITFTRRRALMIVPFLSLLAIALSFIVPEWSTVPYIFVPFIMMRRRK